MDYDNTNSGASFVNDKKTSDNQPDYRGSINVDGNDYWISTWVKVAGERSKSPGSRFLSHALTLKEPVAANELEATAVVAQAAPAGDLPPPQFADVPDDDALPF